MEELDPWKIDPRGTSLIEASAGTGKTYTLTTLYVRMLVDYDLSPRDILVVTYTHAATAELRERVRGRIQEAIAAGEAAPDDETVDPPMRAVAERSQARAAQTGGLDPLRRALQDFDEAAIFTIHGFCQRTLQENAFDSGVAFDTELVQEPDLFDRTMVHDLWESLLEGEDPDFVEWLWAGGGKRWKFEPGELKSNLLSQLGADEEMPVLPDRSGLALDVDYGVLAEEASAAAWAWAESWRDEGGRAEEWLLDKKNLKGTQYKSNVVPKWVPVLDRLCSTLMEKGRDGIDTQFDLPGWFERLGPEFMADQLKPGVALPGERCFALAGTFLKAVEALEAARAERAILLRLRFVESAREAARKRREDLHRLYFDDLLSELRAALRPPEGDRLAELLRARYRFALIDEFQDTDPVQYEIFRRVWHQPEKGTGTAGVESAEGTGGLVLIGDPKQAIYSFRGADVFTYLAAREDAGDDRFALARNYRSDPAVITAVNALFGGLDDAFGIEDIDFAPVKPRDGAVAALDAPGRSVAGLRILMADRERGFELDGSSKAKKLRPRFGRTHLMRAFASDVAGLLASGATIAGKPLDPSQIAVLCRSKVEIAAAKRALDAAGIPCVDRGDSDVFESREAWELATVMHAMLRSGSPERLRAALATGAHGMGAVELIALSDDSPELNAISERYAEYGRVWSSGGWSRAFEAWRRGEHVTPTLLAYDDGERRHTNWLHLAELLQRLVSDRSTSRTSLVAWLERAIASPDARADLGKEASLLRLDRDDEAVSLMTLHGSKGLEFEIVYLPSLWEPSLKGPFKSDPTKKKGAKVDPVPIRFHDPETRLRTLDVGSPNHLENFVRCRQEGISEELRLLYVGLTRAKRQCTILWGAIGDGYAKTPLASLLDPSARRGNLELDAALEKWSDADWWAAFGAVAADAESLPDGVPGAIEIEWADLESRPSWSPEQASRSELCFEPATRVLGRPARTTSFSALVRDAHRAALSGPMLSGPMLIGRDVDADGTTDRVEEEPAHADLAAGMADFPRGARPGTLLHEVLENVDFADLADPQGSAEGGSAAWIRVAELARKALEKHDLDAEYEEQVLHVVRSVVQTPLRAEPEVFRLADVARGQLRPEIEFTLSALGSEGRSRFGPVELASLLEGAAPGSPLERYAERLAAMGWEELHGYLRGFIDAVFFDGQRYFLIDYKSNHLGSQQADYMPDQLVQPMIDHDYVLQYLIYSVALDRHLTRRLAGYDYETHFGGAYYLFLRGLAESHRPGCGVFFDRPHVDVVRAVGALMDETQAEVA